MVTQVSKLVHRFLSLAASSQKLGINLIRISILIIFVWIGGLKFWNYEAEGIVPFVANSPFMNFFYNKTAPEYKEYKMKEGEFNAAKQQWHKDNNTYGFSHGLGVLIMSIGILVFIGMFSPKARTYRSRLSHYHDNRYAFLSGNDSGSLGPGPRKRGTRLSVT